MFKNKYSNENYSNMCEYDNNSCIVLFGYSHTLIKSDQASSSQIKTGRARTSQDKPRGVKSNPNKLEQVRTGRNPSETRP